MTAPVPTMPPRRRRSAPLPRRRPSGSRHGFARAVHLLLGFWLLTMVVAAGAQAVATPAPTAPAPAAAPAATPGSQIQLESRVFEIARQLRCPVCVSESVGDSSSSIAIQMREQIQEQLEDGRSEREILAFFQERYGDWILLEPPRRGIHLLVWLLPVIALLAGAGGLTWLIVRWTRTARQPLDASDEDRARVRAALTQSGPNDVEEGRR